LDLRNRFLSYIESNRLFTKNDRLLIALSGGLDSVVLVHLCHSAGFSFAIAHCNFGLRAAESDGDALFAQQLAVHLAVPYFEKKFDTKAYAADHKLSIQEAARDLRYAWFRELLHQQWNAETSSKAPHFQNPQNLPQTFLLTAHHADDSIETLLINFFKGTGIAGLHGIRPKNGNIVRPLLFAHRATLEDYAREQGLQWREDSSNADPKYTRNAIRNELLPVLEKIFPSVRQNLAANVTRFAEVEKIYRNTVELQLSKLVELQGEEARVPVRKLKKAEPLDTLLWELVQPFHFTPAQVPGLRALLDSSPGRYVTSSTHQAVRHGAWMVFAPLNATDTTLHIIDKEDDSVAFNGQLLELKKLPAVPDPIPADADLAFIDAAALDYPLILRRWKAGDYFYPLGMRKKKKLARFLIDSKLSKVQKENVWVLESHKRIVWVLGRRIDDRFRITPATRRVIQLRVRPLSGPQSASPGI
jgi:tRNA(Ile)-lysidine synthase